MDQDSQPHPHTRRRAAADWLVPSGDDPFVHPAVFYSGLGDYLAHTVPFVLDGLSAEEPVAVAVPGPSLDAIRDEVFFRGGRPEQVTWFDMTDAGRNPGRIIPYVLRAFADQHAGRRVRIIGEPVWPARSRTEYPACVQHEALINNAFHGRQATILCPYDAEHLTDQALTDAAATHPVLVRGQSWQASPDYSPERVVEAYNQPLDVPEGANSTTVAPDALSAIRHQVSDIATHAGLGDDRVLDVVFVTSELATNGIVHGAGTARLFTWLTDGALVIQVDNQGGLADPMAGRIPATPHQQGGRGLLAVNALADLVRIHTTGHHTAIRVHFDLPVAQAG